MTRRTVWRELPRKTQPFKTSAEKYLPSDVSIISVQWRKNINSGLTKKPTGWLTECICSNQEERWRERTPAHKINVQSLTASVGEPQVVDSTPVWYLSITKSRLTLECICHILFQHATYRYSYLLTLHYVMRQNCFQCFDSVGWGRGRKGIQPVKAVWSEVQMICIWSSWCHCHPVISGSSKIQNGLPFWCRLTQVVLEKRRRSPTAQLDCVSL